MLGPVLPSKGVLARAQRHYCDTGSLQKEPRSGDATGLSCWTISRHVTGLVKDEASLRNYNRVIVPAMYRLSEKVNARFSRLVCQPPKKKTPAFFAGWPGLRERVCEPGPLRSRQGHPSTGSAPTLCSCGHGLAKSSRGAEPKTHGGGPAGLFSCYLGLKEGRIISQTHHWILRHSLRRLPPADHCERMRQQLGASLDCPVPRAYHPSIMRQGCGSGSFPTFTLTHRVSVTQHVRRPLAAWYD
jgi:hypothetical protein